MAIWIGHSLNHFVHHTKSPIGVMIDIRGDPGEGPNFKLSTTLYVTKEWPRSKSSNSYRVSVDRKGTCNHIRSVFYFISLHRIYPTSLIMRQQVWQSLLALLRWLSRVLLVPYKPLLALVVWLGPGSIVNHPLINYWWWQWAIPQLVELTSTPKTTTPYLSCPIVGSIVTGPSTSSLYHSLVVSLCLTTLWAILSWPLMLGC